MSNFDFLLSEPQFHRFSSVAIAAEKSYAIDPATCTLNCRRAMEFAVKWIYSVDGAFEKPVEESIFSLITTSDFRDFANQNMLDRLHFIRKVGNQSAHNARKINKDVAALCVEHLFYFLDFVAHCYGENYQTQQFNKSLLEEVENETPTPPIVELELDRLIKENIALKAELSARRKEQIETYVDKPLDLSEYKTRKIYIDVMLADAGWKEGTDWLNEVELKGMPNTSKVGFADYVLYDDAHRPLAVIEAKRTCVDPVKGRQQAKLYADLLEKQCGRRPVIFLTNGFETRIDDGKYPERQVASFYSKRDLEKLFNLRTYAQSLSNISINKNIAGRYYQENAIKATCDTFGEKNRRHALLVMATGAGKTRTVIELCRIMVEKRFIKNVLFLADRNSLIIQAKRNFVNLLPNLSTSNITERDKDYHANVIFSTYQTMINCIDEAKDENGKIFTSGHFDLIICDEAHRSIYNKYKDIFTYFDALLVGLTATPKDEVDKNTYDIFQLENGIPTYGYDLAQAVNDGYLVDYKTIETKLKFMNEGISYDDLSDAEKEEYENTFRDENGEFDKHIASSALNEWLYNENTIKQVLSIVMQKGIKVDGSKIGKTIIFAKSHYHAEEIFKIFGKEYPHLNNYAKVIDNYSNYAQSLIDEFSVGNQLPQIAISVDMLDTGIDVPEVLNLVFFKKVMSKAKFWQMIGRGTRLCPGLLDGKDKEKFYIFDFCNNFEFFRLKKGNETPNTTTVQGAIFRIKLMMIYKLQALVLESEFFKGFRAQLVDDVVAKIKELNRENFMVRQHLKYVEKYSAEDSFNVISYEEAERISFELSKLIHPYDGEATAVRFDALVYAIELAYVEGSNSSRRRKELYKLVWAVSQVANIPEIEAQKELIMEILHGNLIEKADVNQFEYIRENIRNLIKYIDRSRPIFETDFDDEVLETAENDSDLSSDDLKNYKKKAENYVRTHQENEAIRKLKTNKALLPHDVEELENILWKELGTKEDYQREIGEKPLGEFVRGIVGLDMNAAKEAFSAFLNDNSLNSQQIYFVNQIIEYIVDNGLLKDLRILTESPFSDQGGVVELFEDLSVFQRIKKVIEDINTNAA